MEKEIAVAQPTVMEILSQAVLSGSVNVEVIERLARLQGEMMDRTAKTAYAEAFAKFKAEVPAIVKDAEIKVKDVIRSRYAKLDQVAEKVIPALLAVGITNRWKTSTGPDGRITVTCYLRHVLGHEEEGASMTSSPDTSGSMNSLQGQGSTVSYLERYTFVASCGIVIKDQDDDGNRSVPQSDVDKMLEAIAEAKDLKELSAAYASATKFTAEKRDGKTLLLISDAGSKRKKELTEAKNG